MVRTQIQLPDPLYQEVKRIAAANDWSIAEVVRRGVEAVARTYPPGKEQFRNGWTMPKPARARLRITDPDELKARIRTDQEAPAG